MDNLLSFLNTLLGIEVAVFGIISAVILVFIQLVYSNFSYKHIGYILKNGWLILFFVFSIIDLILTFVGSYYLSFNGNVFTPESSQIIGSIVTSQVYVLICWGLIFISISFFVILIVRNITYLQPHRAIFILAKSIRYEDIRDFLWKKYELQPPFNMRVRVHVVGFDGDGSEDIDEKKAKREMMDEVAEKSLEKTNNYIRYIKESTINSEDPLLPLRDMMIQFIRRSDLSSLTEAQDLLQAVSNDFINKVPKQTREEWSPNDVLLTNFTRYQTELISTLLEISEKEELESAQKILLRFGFDLARLMLDASHFHEFDMMQKFFRGVADKSIGRYPTIFQEIIEFYQSAGEKLFDLLKDKSTAKHADKNEEFLNQIFRSVGWLGERLLTRLPFEESPIMMNYEHSTEYGTLLNCILTFSSDYDNQPRSYPLIYFDCVYVVLKKMILISKTTKSNWLSDNVFSLAHTYASFAEKAIVVGNAEGACLAATNIKQVYVVAKKEGLDKDAQDMIKLLVNLGIMSSGKKEKLRIVDFMSKGLETWIADTLVESGENINDEVLERYIHAHNLEDHDGVWEFITKLGVRLGTNFGFAFDSKTGETYSENDSRRR